MTTEGTPATPEGVESKMEESGDRVTEGTRQRSVGEFQGCEKRRSLAKQNHMRKGLMEKNARTEFNAWPAGGGIAFFSDIDTYNKHIYKYKNAHGGNRGTKRICRYPNEERNGVEGARHGVARRELGMNLTALLGHPMLMQKSTLTY